MVCADTMSDLILNKGQCDLFFIFSDSTRLTFLKRSWICIIFAFMIRADTVSGLILIVGQGGWSSDLILHHIINT